MSDSQQLLFFSTLLQLEKQARLAKDPTELAYVAVNETIRLLRYRTALLWRLDLRGRPVVTTVSGVDQPDAHAPMMEYTAQMLAALSPSLEGKAAPPRVVTAADLAPNLRPGWEEFGFHAAAWCPLVTPEGHGLGGILFNREDAWTEAETALLQRLCEAYAHALAALEGRRGAPVGQRARRILWRMVQLTALAGAAALLALPVRLSALAPAAIVPQNPLLVTAPLDGVVQSFQVEPNQPVAPGDRLFTLDDTSLRNEHAIAEKSVAVTEAELVRHQQKAFADPASRAQILHLEAFRDQRRAEAAYLLERLAKCEIRAAQGGIAIFSDPDDWLGRPVRTGEKILTIADPHQVEVEVWLPVEDAIDLSPGAPLRLFLNTDPDRPLAAELRQASYEAEVTDQGVLAFRLRARLAPDTPPPRPGLRGTAKIYGEETNLFTLLLRRPILAVRQRLGV